MKLSPLLPITLLLCHYTAAVLLNDAFKIDWTLALHGPLRKPTLFGPDTMWGLSSLNILYQIATVGGVLNYIDLSLHGHSDYHLWGSSIASFSNVSLTIALFDASSGIYIDTLELGSPPAQIEGSVNGSLTVLDDNGNLLLWDGAKLHDLGSFKTNTFAQVLAPKAHYIMVGLATYEVSYNQNNVYSLNSIASDSFRAAILPHVKEEMLRSVVSPLAEVPKYISEDTVVAVSGNHLQVFELQNREPQLLILRKFDQIIDFKANGSSVIVLTNLEAFFLEFSTFLSSREALSVVMKSLKCVNPCDSACDDQHLSVLSLENNGIKVSRLDTNTGASSFWQEWDTSATHSIIANRPESLDAIDKARHLQEDSHSGSIVHRLILRYKNHLSELGQAFSKLSLAKKTSKSDESDDLFGFDKILISFNSRTNQVWARSTKTGKSEYLAQHFVAPLDGDFIKLVAINDNVYIVFQHAVLMIPLRPELVLLRSQNYKDSIQNAFEVSDDVNSTLVLQFAESFELFGGDALLKADGVFIKTQENTIRAYKNIDGTLKLAWQWLQPSEEILHVEKSRNIVSANRGISRSDRSVLYKYFNPDLISIFTKDANGSLRVTLLDGASGSVLHTQQHTGEQVDLQSICVTQTDNWVVYSFHTNSPSSEQRIIVIDLFEDSKTTLASPEVSIQSFIFPEEIVSLKSTETKYGVTVKSVIALTESGSLIEIPKHTLDSRRIVGRKMTPMDYQDGFRLSPYEPVILKNTFQVLNHKNQLKIDRGHQQISVMPTNLESSTVVCVSNQYNQFCTIVQPSLPYDLLKSGFEKLKLIATIVAIFAIYIVIKPFVHSKRLNSKWVD